MSALDQSWKCLCTTKELLADGGVAALVDGQQLALFYLPGQDCQLYAIDNIDPASGAAVLARGIIGDIAGEPVVASPLYKQHYSLRTGRCLEDASLSVQAWPCMLLGDQVYIDSVTISERLAG